MTKLTDEDINKIAEKVAKILSGKKPVAARVERGRYQFMCGDDDEVYDLADYTYSPAVIDMTDEGCGCFYLVDDANTGALYWVGSFGVKKDYEEMAEFLQDELRGEFRITEF